MNPRSLAFFAGAVALSTLAAWWRWPDSAHAIGVIKRGGGAARHPVAFRPGPERYHLVATAAVLPGWRGDARISVEGDPPLRFTAALDGPVVDLGVHRFPRLEGDVIRGLEPRERIALWLTLAPPEAAPPEGVDGCRAASRADPARYRAPPPASYRLALRDAATGAPLLAIPIAFGGAGGEDAAHH